MNVKNLKPFNLQAALKGEPVMLRGGSKAFVRHHESGIDIGSKCTLVGFIEGRPRYQTWQKDGVSCVDYNDDIVGMYQKTRAINGFEVPVPETKEPNEGDWYFIANISHTKFYESFVWYHNRMDEIFMERGLVFLNKDDAIANSKAMIGIDPYRED